MGRGLTLSAVARIYIDMPYKDPQAKRRYMERYYREKIKPGEIPSTSYRKRSYGLMNTNTHKTLTQTPEKPVVLVPNAPASGPPSAPAAQRDDARTAPVALVLALLIVGCTVVRGAPCFPATG
jgi:hypothetical protein